MWKIPVIALLIICSVTGLLAQEDIPGYIDDLTEENGIDVRERLEDLKSDPVSLNSAATGDLLLVPWIDSILAERIIRFRESRGRFTKISELKMIEGMNYLLYMKIVPFVKIEPERKFLARVDTRNKAGRDDVRMRLSGSGRRFRTAFKMMKDYEGESRMAGYLRVTPPIFTDFSVTGGDFILSLGQGLLSWSAFGGLRSPEKPVVYPFSGRSVRGTTGTVDGRALRGGAVTMSWDSFDVSIARGANAGGTGSRVVSSIGFGLHSLDPIRIGGSYLTIGRDTSYVAVTSELTRGRSRWFTEIVKKTGSGSGVLSGLKRSFGPTAFVFLYRRLSHDYFSPFGFDMSQGGSGVGNLEAAYFGLTAGKGGRFEISLYRDVGRQLFPEADSKRANFDEAAVCIKTRPAEKITMVFSVRGRELASGGGGGDRESRWRIRWDSILRPVSNLTIKTRAQIQAGDESESGTTTGWRASLLCVDVKTSLPAGIGIRARFTSYNSSEGGTLYIVEGGLPGRSHVLRLSGAGERYQLVLKKNLGKSYTLRCRLSGGGARRSTHASGFDFESWRAEEVFEFQAERRF